MSLGYTCIQCIPGQCLRCGISDGKEQQPFYEEKSQDLNLKKKICKRHTCVLRTFDLDYLP